MSRSTPGSPRIVTYGFFGMGNIGNEASLEAFLSHLASVRPNARVRCLCTDPERVRRQHGIPARRLSGGRPGSRSLALRAGWRLVDPLRTWWLLGGADVVVVPGMGVFENGLGAANPFGLPYWLFALALGARLRRRPLLFLCVGADPPHQRVTALFFRWAARLAHYRSYRDQLSADAMRDLMGTDDPGPVYTDLAFGLPLPAGTPVPGRVVVGVMRFGDRDDPAQLGTYADKIADLVARLVAQGDDVRLVVGAVADFDVADDIAGRARALLARGPDPEAAGRVQVSRADTQTAVTEEMVQAEVVVASRYHNLIAALRAGVPTVSLGYAGKNAALLAEFGGSVFDQEIETFDTDLLVTQVAHARVQTDRTKLNEVVTSLRERLNEQYRMIETVLNG